MSGKVIPISSSAHFRKVTGSSSYTIVDFYATWCGPCKTISPIFEQLAAAESKPGRLTFCKVDVDDHQDISGQYGVSAMPTFLVLKGSTVKDTIQGANPSALRSAVLAASADAGRGTAATPATFTGKGQTLGTSEGGSQQAPLAMPNLGQLLSSPAQFAQGRGVVASVIRFLGLYFTTLISLEPDKAAEDSSFSIKGQRGTAGHRVGTVH